VKGIAPEQLLEEYIMWFIGFQENDFIVDQVLVAGEMLPVGGFTLDAVFKMTLAEWMVMDVPPSLGKRLGENVKEFLKCRGEQALDSSCKERGLNLFLVYSSHRAAYNPFLFYTINCIFIRCKIIVLTFLSSILTFFTI
jgi:hypothetical protein